MSFETLGLGPALLRALAESGYVTPTPIQAQSIPLILSGHDLLGGAQTGTGKTAAFGLPLLQRLAGAQGPRGPRKPRALVLVPTRELAVQVADSLHAYGKHLRLQVATLFGGVGMRPQVERLRRGVDIIVACPGRLIDHMQGGDVALDAIEMLVLDEADRMLDMGFLPAINRIVSKVPSRRQTLLFSATFEPRIRALALEFMRDPQQVQVAANNTIAETIVHRAHPVDSGRKRDLLIDLLARRHMDQVLVFGRTKHGCNRLAEQLEKAGLTAVAIHGNKSQAQRQKALDAFKSGKSRILVATDVAARGLDIPNLPLVINHDLPLVAEDYVHRIGRTGRNGASGEALSLVSPEEGSLLGEVQKMLKAEIALETVAGFEPSQPVRVGHGNASAGRGRGGGGRGASRGGGRAGGARPPAPRQAADGGVGDGNQPPRQRRSGPGPGARGHAPAQPRAGHAHAGPRQPRGDGQGPQRRRGGRGQGSGPRPQA